MKYLLRLADWLETVAQLIRIYNDLKQDTAALEMLEQIESEGRIQRIRGEA